MIEMRAPSVAEVIVNLIGNRYGGNERADLIAAAKEAYERRVWNLWKGSVLLAAMRQLGMTLQEITEETGWSKSTASRIINHQPAMPGVWYVDKSLKLDGPGDVDDVLGALLGEDEPVDRQTALMRAAQVCMERRRQNSEIGAVVLAGLKNDYGMDVGEIAHLLNTTPEVVLSWAQQAPVSTYGEVGEK